MASGKLTNMVQQVLLTAVLLVSAVQEIYSTATDPCSDSSQHSSCCCNGLSPNVFPDASSAYESSHAEGSRVSTRGRLPTFIIRTSDTVVDEPKIDATVCVCLPSGQPLSKLATRESNYNKWITSNNTWRLHYQGALSIEVRSFQIPRLSPLDVIISHQQQSINNNSSSSSHRSAR
jgi:hypothetical protein